MKFFGVVAAHDHRKRIVEAERRHHLDVETRAIFFLHAVEYRRRDLSLRRIIQNGRQRRARIFGIKIDFSRDQRLMADQRAAKIHSPFHAQRRVRLDLLREQFRQHDLLGKIFRSDDNRVSASLCRIHSATVPRART